MIMHHQLICPFDVTCSDERLRQSGLLIHFLINRIRQAKNQNDFWDDTVHYGNTHVSDFKLCIIY